MGCYPAETSSWDADYVVGCVLPEIEVNWFTNRCVGKGGKVADPPGAAPRKRVVESPSKVAGAKRIVLRYGPYSVPNMNKTGLTGEPGALWLVCSYRLMDGVLMVS